MKDNIYFSEFNKIIKIIEEYSSKCESIITELSTKVVYEQYGVGGKCLHRGYFCPSRIIDVITGNINRGKIKKNINKPDFTFGFDRNNKLVLVKQENIYEFIIYQDDNEIGITVLDDFKITAISYCKYATDRICEYTFCLYDPYKKQIIEINKEIYSYSENKMEVDWFRFFDINSLQNLVNEKYVFNLVDGYLSTYMIQKIDNNKTSAYSNSDVFRVKLKRQV